jgi:ribosome-associated protein
MSERLPTRETLARSVGFLREHKAQDLVVLDLRGIADFTDHFVICTGHADVHVRALADAVIHGMKDLGNRPLHVEGYDSRKWVLIDFVDVVIHILQADERTFYGLERLWGDAPVLQIAEDAPALAP